MKITQISLTNFRSFKDTQVIDLAPVTLMFGPNSAGKSSVFSALFYIQQILEKKQCDPMYIDTLNKKYVGGFENLVYKRDLDSTIKINIKYEVGETKSKSYTYLYPLIEKELDIKLESPVKKTISISTEFEIAWSRVKNKAYIKTYIVYFEDVEVAITECDDDLKPSITFLNYIHPLLWPKNHSEWLKEQEVSKASVHVYNQLEIYGIDNYDDEPKDPIVNGEMLGIDSIITVNLLTGKIELDLDQSIEHYREIYPNEDFDGDKYIGYINEVLPKKLNDKLSFNISGDTFYVSALHKLIHASEWNEDTFITVDDIHEYRFLHNSIEIYDTEDALPPLGKKLFNSLDLGDVKKSEIVSELLSDVCKHPTIPSFPHLKNAR